LPTCKRMGRAVSMVRVCGAVRTYTRMEKEEEEEEALYSQHLFKPSVVAYRTCSRL
jgi:hypothetical protein